MTSENVPTYSVTDHTNQYMYTVRDIENIIADLVQAKADLSSQADQAKVQEQITTWQNLLDQNLAYVWNKDYAPFVGLPEGDPSRKTFQDFLTVEGNSLPYDNSKGEFETLIFSAGPTFEYSRTIAQSNFVN